MEGLPNALTRSIYCLLTNTCNAVVLCHIPQKVDVTMCVHVVEP